MDDALKQGHYAIYLNVETWLLFPTPIKISGYAPGTTPWRVSGKIDALFLGFQLISAN